jgi:hypothetical protein
MDQDPYQPIRAKVDQIKQWHSFFSRFCYAYCRAIFVIVGAFVGAAATPTAYYLIVRPPAMTSEAVDITSAIGGVAGLVAGLYFVTVAVRFVKAFVFPANRSVKAGRTSND